MTLRAQIESLLADRPMTGAEIRERIGGTSTAVHRYLCEMRRRGVLAARRECGRIVYAMRGYVWPQRSPWDWR
jgi:hypothetical protein